jgi:hypothetical protein
MYGFYKKGEWTMARTKPDELRAEERARKTAAFIKGTMKMLGMTQQKLADATDRRRENIASYVRTARHVTPPGWFILELLELRENFLRKQREHDQA